MSLSSITHLAGPASVISLDRRKDRRDSVTEHLQALEIDYQIFPAVDGNDLSDSDPRVVNQKGFDKPNSSWMSKDLANKKARVGCSLSHFNVVKEAKLSGKKCVLITEDDVRFSQMPEDILRIRKVFDETWQNLPADCDILFLGTNHRTPPIQVNERVVRCTGAIGGHAYIVFERYYDRFLALFQENFARIGNPDGTGGLESQDTLLRSVQSVDNHYAINPLIATQDSGESDIVLDALGRPMVVDYASRLHHLETFLPIANQLQPLMPDNTILSVWDLSHKGRSSCKIYKITYIVENIPREAIVQVFPKSKIKAYQVEVSARKELEDMQLEAIVPVADLNPAQSKLEIEGQSYYVTINSYADGVNFDDLLRKKQLFTREYRKFGAALAELACDGKDAETLKKGPLSESDRERLYARSIFEKIDLPEVKTKLLEAEAQHYERLLKSSNTLYGSHEHGDPHGGNFFSHKGGITPIDLAGRDRTKGATGVMGNELYNALHAIVLYGLRYGHSLEELTQLQDAFYEGYTQRLRKKGIVLSREVEEYYALVWSGFLLYHASKGDAGRGWDDSRIQAAIDNTLLVSSRAYINELTKTSEQLAEGLTLEKYSGSFCGKQMISVLTYDPVKGKDLKLVPSKTSAAAYPEMHSKDHNGPEYINVHIGEGVPMKIIAEKQTDAIAVINGVFYQYSHEIYEAPSQLFAKGDFVDFAKLRGHIYNQDKLPTKSIFEVESQIQRMRLSPQKWADRIKSLENDLKAMRMNATAEREIGWLVQMEKDGPFEILRADSIDSIGKLEKAKYAIPAKPVLIWDGEPSRIEQTSAQRRTGEKKVGAPGCLDHLYEKAPRTIWGQTEDGRWQFIVVDGRQDEAVGMTFDEMVLLMKQLGVVRALNADGGGSSSVMVRRQAGAQPEFVNAIQKNDQDRPVGNVLFIFNMNYSRPEEAAAKV